MSNYTSITPLLLLNKKLKLIASKVSMEIEFSPRVLEALEDFSLLLNSSASNLRFIFRPLVDQWTTSFELPPVSDEEVDRVIRDYLSNHGFNIVVAHIYLTHDSAESMMVYPVVPEAEVTADTKPTLILDGYLSSYDRGNRQWFLTFARLLHESAHALAPGLDRLCRAKKSNRSYDTVQINPKFITPEIIGPISWKRGDSGAGFEDLVFGGRVQPTQCEVSRPFFKELELITRPWLQYPPVKNPGNFSRNVIPDTFIAEFHQKLQAWKITPTHEIFMNLKIVTSDVIEVHYAKLITVQSYFERKAEYRKRARGSSHRSKQLRNVSESEEESEEESDEDDDSLDAVERAYEAMVSKHPHRRK